MENFYDKWLRLWEDSAREKNQARKVIHEEELEWVETPQDFKVALLAAPENGFRTWGSETLIAEIPPQSHTGRHVHGEEAIFIVEGTGFTVVDGTKYEWETSSTLWIPFGAEHQHFNNGTTPVRYLSSMALHLEHMCGLAKLDQLDAKGRNNGPLEIPRSKNGFDAKGRRIVLRYEDAPSIDYDPEDARRARETRETGKAQVWEHNIGGGHHDKWKWLMGGGKTEFQNREVEISNIMGDEPGHYGGNHGHMEALIYILDGEGYSTIEGVKTPWKKGSLLHIVGPQTQHQHFNTGKVQSGMLRVGCGVRKNFYEPIAKERFPKIWFSARGKIGE
jgi:quercetin dioxygenase-like cupin family protein